MQIQTIKDTIEKLIKSIIHEEYDIVREIFADDIDNSITTAQGEAFHLVGAEQYINALKRMNFAKIKPTISLTQINVLNDHEALFMLEIKAKKGNHLLHNHAAYLAKFKNNKIISMDMVEAQPKYSDKFWNEF